MKKNNKGFLLVETLVVSTFCLTVLVILFLQFRTLIINYNNSFKYNTVEGIYNLATMKKFLDKPDRFKFNDSGYTIIECPDKTDDFHEFCNSFMEGENIKTLIYTDKKLSEIPSLKEDKNLTEGMKKFVSHLKDNEKTNRLIAEFNDEESNVQTYASITY